MVSVAADSEVATVVLVEVLVVVDSVEVDVEAVHLVSDLVHLVVHLLVELVHNVMFLEVQVVEIIMAVMTGTMVVDMVEAGVGEEVGAAGVGEEVGDGVTHHGMVEVIGGGEILFPHGIIHRFISVAASYY